MADSSPGIFVYGKAQGQARVIATSNGMSDTAIVQVVGVPAPVATVSVRPATATFTVGDSAGFYADLYDSVAAPIYNRPISWFVTDSTVLRIQAYGPSLLVRALKAGNATVRATSEGKTGQAAVTVNP